MAVPLRTDGHTRGRLAATPPEDVALEAPLEVIRGTRFLCCFRALRSSWGWPSSSEWRWLLVANRMSKH